MLGQRTGTLKNPWPVTKFLHPPVFLIYKNAIIFNELKSIVRLNIASCIVCKLLEDFWLKGTLKVRRSYLKLQESIPNVYLSVYDQLFHLALTHGI